MQFGLLGTSSWHQQLASQLVLILPCILCPSLSWCSPKGTWADATKTQAVAALGCSRCASGYYRSGDASAENNECREIPPGEPSGRRAGLLAAYFPVGSACMCLQLVAATWCCSFLLPPSGYKASALIDDAGDLGAYEINVCGIGTVSYWKLNAEQTARVRVPTAGNTCQSCALETNKNLYAPRTGAHSAAVPADCCCNMRMQCSATGSCPAPVSQYPKYRQHLAGMTACLPCKGGTVAAITQEGDPLANKYAGPDYCKACGTGLYRSFYDITQCVCAATCYAVGLRLPCVQVLHRCLPPQLTPTACPCCSDTCQTCAAGNEVGPSNRQACTQW